MASAGAEVRRDDAEGRVRAALAALWPGAGGALPSAALLAHLEAEGAAVPARELYLLLESFQMRGWVRLSRGEAAHAARDAHGARAVLWVNPALLA